MSPRLIEYDPTRIDELLHRAQRVADHLAALGAIDDPAAFDAVSTVRAVRASIEDEWLPLLTRIASSTAMKEFSATHLGDSPASRVRPLHALLLYDGEDPAPPTGTTSTTTTTATTTPTATAEVDAEVDAELADAGGGYHDPAHLVPSYPASFDEATDDAGQWPDTSLPKGGEFPFEPRRGDHGRPKKLRGDQGYIDKHGNKWRPDREKHWEEWDVTPPGGHGHINVDPNGHITHRSDIELELDGEIGPGLDVALCISNPSCTAAAAAGAAAAVAGAILVFGT